MKNRLFEVFNALNKTNLNEDQRQLEYDNEILNVLELIRKIEVKYGVNLSNQTIDQLNDYYARGKGAERNQI